jgi:hypothetical protein
VADDVKPDDKPAPKTDPPAPDLTKAVEALLARHSDPNAALRVLLGENNTLRDQVKDVTGKLPAAGSLVLKGDDARAWEAYQGLGKPADVRKAIEEGAEFKGKATRYEQEKLHAQAAAVAGYKPAVLDRLAVQDGLAIVVTDGKDKGKDGQPVKVAVVRTKDDKGADVDTPLADHAAKHWGDFLPALKGDDAPAPAPAGSPTRTGTHPPRPAIRPDAPRRSLVR